MNNQMHWNPRPYLKFSDHRLRPALDLMARIPDGRRETVYDLGCGPGTVTRLLAERWPESCVTGLDSSPDMLKRARQEVPAIDWLEADIATWSPPASTDLIFSNAALHWLDDHETLMPHLLSMLQVGGVLAVQMPKNHGAPSHTLMAESAQSGPWRDLLAPHLRPAPVADMGFYYDLLADRAASINLWESTYGQSLHGDDPVLEWVGSTALKPLLDAFDAAGESDWKQAFLLAYAGRLRQAYPKRKDGSVLFPFRRLFLVAVK